MDKKITGKIGEAYAFAQVLSDLQERTPAVLTELLGNEAAKLEEYAAAQRAQLEQVATEGAALEAVLEKVGRTRDKINAMGEQYVGDSWDDPAEVLEWFSFFLGAAVIHWQLITGCGKALKQDAFQSTAQEGADYYAGLLDIVRTKAEDIGYNRAAA